MKKPPEHFLFSCKSAGGVRWGGGGGEVIFVFAIKEKLVYPNRRKRRKVRGNVKFLPSTKQHKMSTVIILVNFTFRY